MRTLFISAWLFTLAACGITTNTFSDYDQSRDFSKYQTFAWAGKEPYSIQSDYLVNPFIIENIMRSIEVEFETKGYKLVGAREQADFVIAFTIGARDKIKVTEQILGTSDIERWAWGQQFYTVRHAHTDETVHQYVEGVLSIDAFDADEKRPVWHGYGKKRLNSKEQRGSTEGIAGAVESILLSFPNKQK